MKRSKEEIESELKRLKDEKIRIKKEKELGQLRDEVEPSFVSRVVKFLKKTIRWIEK